MHPPCCKCHCALFRDIELDKAHVASTQHIEIVHEDNEKGSDDNPFSDLDGAEVKSFRETDLDIETTRKFLPSASSLPP